MEGSPSPRRRFQFRLRMLFIAMTILAVQCAVCLPMLKEWKAQEPRRASYRQQLQLMLQSQGAKPRIVPSERP
jgi:hypothetical protein